jgi:transcription antitermination factor NusG
MGTSLLFDGPERLSLPADFRTTRWFAAYTCANHEKRVREQLERRRVESFLPVYESVRRWKDRRVRLELPLFSGYIFVRIAPADRLQVLEVPGVVRIVGFNGQFTALPDEEIESLKRGLASGVRAEPHPFLTVGRRVYVTRGPFEGRQGILLRKKGQFRLLLSIELIQRSIVVDVDALDVEPMKSDVGAHQQRLSKRGCKHPTI